MKQAARNRVLVIAAIIAVIGSYLLFAYLRRPSDWDMVSKEDIQSPDGRYVATVFEMCSYDRRHRTPYVPTLTTSLVGLLCIMLLLGCSRTDNKNMQTFLDKISHGSESELGGLLYGYSQASPGAQQVLLGMLRPLRAPSPDKHMTIEASRDAGRFTMLVVRVPWPQATQGAGFQPIIICRDGGRELVVGYVLPFNDIFHHFQGSDSASIMQLSDWWIQNYATRH